MNEFKYQFVNILLLALLGFGIYWAFSTIDNGIIYDRETPAAENQGSQTSPESKDTEPKVIFDNTKPTEDPVVKVEKNTPASEEKVLSEEEHFLLGKLEGLIADKIQMRKGSRGTRVGTVQKFLNRYFEKQTKVDNQYGPTTIARVKEFQQKEGLSADGFAGINTYKKMIEILKK